MESEGKESSSYLNQITSCAKYGGDNLLKRICVAANKTGSLMFIDDVNRRIR